jgi:hypothetical protein
MNLVAALLLKLLLENNLLKLFEGNERVLINNFVMVRKYEGSGFRATSSSDYHPSHCTLHRV